MPCGRNPITGLNVCRQCGGGAKQARAAGRRRTAAAAAEKIVATYGIKADTNPVEALLDEVQWTAGHVAWLREQVQNIEAEALTWGKVEEVDKHATEFAGTDITHAAKVNVWLDLYQRERAHLVAVCKTAIGAGIAERQVRLAEAHGAIIVEVIRGILDDLDLTAPQRLVAAEAVPRRLRAVA